MRVWLRKLVLREPAESIEAVLVAEPANRDLRPPIDQSERDRRKREYTKAERKFPQARLHALHCPIPAHFHGKLAPTRKQLQSRATGLYFRARPAEMPRRKQSLSSKIVGRRLCRSKWRCQSYLQDCECDIGQPRHCT